MSNPDMAGRGTVVGLRRHPVKSMRGEEVSEAELTVRGLLGDRAYALVDVETGHVVSTKNPRKWANMFSFQAAYAEEPRVPESIPAAQITFPDGSTASTDEPGLDERLSDQVGRAVRLAASVPDAPRIEGYWPDYEWLESPNSDFQVKLPPGTFFDAAVVHLLTTATLARLRSLSPQSLFDVARFRPNIIIDVAGGAEGFVENDWVGHTLLIGDEVRLRIMDPCPRCVMTTLPQGDLPKDPNVLRTVVQHNHGNVGVLAEVIQGGRMHRGDLIVLA